MRLQKYLAMAGIASRRKAEEYILAGRVQVNGEKITTLGTSVEEDDIVKYNGKIVRLQNQYVYYLLNKPVGYVTTVSDEKDRPTVLDLMKRVPYRIFPVGRLDYNTSGLLLLTNDGELTYKLTHPKHEVTKTYEAKVRGHVNEGALEKLRKGIIIDRRKTRPAEVSILKVNEKTTTLSITIHEGRNRQVRKMCEAVGHEVLGLRRIAIGELTLKGINIGEYRRLTEAEVDYLRNEGEKYVQ